MEVTVTTALAIDDFGRAIPSLSRLLDLPVAIAKIDKSLVAGMPAVQPSQRLVGGILLMAATLDIQVVAEDVETADQATHLTEAGCQLLQGFYLGRPQDADDLTAAWRWRVPYPIGRRDAHPTAHPTARPAPPARTWRRAEIGLCSAEASRWINFTDTRRGTI